MSHWVAVSRYIHWHFTFSEPLGGGFSLYTLTFHIKWATGWGFLAIYTDISHSVSHWVGFLAIYTDISHSVSHWVGVSRYIHWHFTFSESQGGFSRYIHWHFTFSESLGGGFSLYTLTFHLQRVTGWRFLAIYIDISPSVSHWVAVSRYIHWHFTFSEPLGGGFSLYTWHFTFSEPLGEGFSLYTLTFHIQWVTGWRFLAIYTDISHSVSHWVAVSRYIHWHFTFSEPLGGGFSVYTLTFHIQWVTGWDFSLYTLIFHLQWATGWGFLAIYTDITHSVSHWVGVSRYIHWHFIFSEPLGGGFLLYTLIFHIQWVTGWGFSLYILTFHIQWATGWGFLGIYTDISHSVSHCVGFLAIYTDISPSVSHWVAVSRYIHWYFTFSEPLGRVSRYIYWHFTFSEPLGGGFSVYTLTFHIQWATGWGFSLYTLTFHIQWATWWGFLAINTDISPSVSHRVGVSHYIHWHLTSASQWVRFLAV